MTYPINTLSKIFNKLGTVFIFLGIVLIYMRFYHHRTSHISNPLSFNFLKNVKPEHQQYCINFITNNVTESQFEQDLFLYKNFFYKHSAEGLNGFYIDSGANDARRLSNTFFLDVCLGWDGLCIEPMPEYHEDLKRSRSCKLVPECISTGEKQVNLAGSGATARVVDGDGTTKCSSLPDILEKYANGRRKIDFWSIDMEGYELKVLSSLDFNDIDVKLMLIEDFFVSIRQLDLLLTRNGYVKFHELAIDSVFVKRGIELPPNVWYPPHYDENIRLNREYRESVKEQLTCV